MKQCNNSQDKKKDQKKMLKCFYCKKNSHFKKDCRNFLNRADKKGTSKTRICFENSFVDVPHSTWWIYMGATSHISNSL